MTLPPNLDLALGVDKRKQTKRSRESLSSLASMRSLFANRPLCTARSSTLNWG